MESTLTPFAQALLFIIGGILFIAGGLLTARLVRPSRPDDRKLTSYESGEQPMGDAWGRINVRFYLLALVFLLFEVEIIFLFPWAVVFGREEFIESTMGKWGWYTFTEMIVFIGILFLGLLYAWKKGYLDWPGPGTKPRSFRSPVPREMYDSLNRKYGK